MDFRELCCWLFSEDYKDRITIFDTVKTTEPGHCAAFGLDRKFVTGLYFAVCTFEVLPFKVIGCRDNASV